MQQGIDTIIDRILADPMLLIITLVLINGVTAGLFVADKKAAQQRAYRIPESALLMACLVGGSPAAYFTMEKIRHKTKKQSFRGKYWMIVLLQVGLLAVWILDIPIL